MLHRARRWCVTEVSSAEELARMLTETTWCCCAAFSLSDYCWLNDSTSPDGAQEYAVLTRDRATGKWWQIESITFGWCDIRRAREHLDHTLRGKDDRNDFRYEVEPILETRDQHGRCPHCA